MRIRIAKPFAFLMVLTCALAIGCSRDTTSSETSVAPGGKPKIALIMKSLANEYFSTMANGARNHAEQNSDQYTLIVNGIKDETDLSGQVALVDEMVAAGVNAIVIAPADSKALAPALRKAIKQGIVVVNIDNQLDREVLTAEGISIPFAGPDNRSGAKKVAEYLAKRLQKGDEVAILEGIQTAANSQQRVAGFEDAMNELGADIVSKQSAQWEMSQANTVASSILSEHPQLKAILAANDSMALGAIAAVKAAGKSDEVLIVGFDNITAIQDALMSGKVLATADQYADQQAVFGIELAMKHLQNPDEPATDTETPVDLVTAESLAETTKE
ncbi:sugar ABC transporter substrate-binding protein [Rhodopirellula sp. MGV]|uniref:sugar ABC transporter substrate-binding protein n=1 Tax=Rhodopirellula sp. MGV TaxID=2023130 RepID=UPI000B976297|nr:sugar ABC transporter substrate-binding protein [Rhodopirellula sp. MGV]OYP39183.1 LacI family transcriptional regulator [Rhodopirellula sp. MGV]PNY35440.1 sugar ABC transporter substrate-binding protein [Rhodopirellula baltica]